MPSAMVGSGCATNVNRYDSRGLEVVSVCSRDIVFVRCLGLRETVSARVPLLLAEAVAATLFVVGEVDSSADCVVE